MANTSENPKNFRTPQAKDNQKMVMDKKAQLDAAKIADKERHLQNGKNIITKCENMDQKQSRFSIDEGLAKEVESLYNEMLISKGVSPMTVRLKM